MDGHVTSEREKRDAYSFFGGGDLKERDHLEDLGVDGGEYQTDLEEMEGRGLDWSGSR